MKSYVVAGLLLVGLATPAFAAEHFAVMDTVGNCSVIDTKPSPYGVSGLKILGDRSGYSNSVCRRGCPQVRQLSVQRDDRKRVSHAFIQESPASAGHSPSDSGRP